MVFVLLFFSSIILNTISQIQYNKLENSIFEVQRLKGLFTFELVSELQEKLYDSKTKTVIAFPQRIEINGNEIYVKDGEVIIKKGE